MIYTHKNPKAACISVGKRITRVTYPSQQFTKFKQLKFMNKHVYDTLKRVNWTIAGPEELCKWKS